MSGKLGLREVVAMGVGGMVSGGIFAVLGVAMHQAGNAVPISFLVAGILTLLTAYSYIKLTLYYGENGGAFSFIEHAVENQNVAGFFGWVLIVGYIGVMAMYSHAFGAYLTGLVTDVLGFLTYGVLRPVLSIAIVAVLVGINLIGVKESGTLEDVLVYLKVGFLLFIAVTGIYFFSGNFPDASSFFNKGVISPITGFAIIFVAYEGFQLLCYDYREIKDVRTNLRKGMLISVAMAIIIYISVSFMAALYLSPEMVVQYKEYALAQAVKPFLLGGVGFVLVVITALQSTASGINATLFGASRLAHRVATEKQLPRIFSFRSKEGIPTYSLLIMGALTALFAAFGSLEQITEFGSVAFLVADGAANYANLRLWRKTDSNPLIPAMGFAGVAAALPIVIYHLFTTEPHILASIAVIFLTVFVVEFFYKEREEIVEVFEDLDMDVERIEKVYEEAKEVGN